MVVLLGSTTFGNEIVCPEETHENTALDQAEVDWDSVPVLGTANHRPLCNDATAAGWSVGCSVGGTVVSALEADEQVTGECAQ